MRTYWRAQRARQEGRQPITPKRRENVKASLLRLRRTSKSFTRHRRSDVSLSRWPPLFVGGRVHGARQNWHVKLRAQRVLAQRVLAQRVLAQRVLAQASTNAARSAGFVEAEAVTHVVSSGGQLPARSRQGDFSLDDFRSGRRGAGVPEPTVVLQEGTGNADGCSRTGYGDTSMATCTRPSAIHRRRMRAHCPIESGPINPRPLSKLYVEHRPVRRAPGPQHTTLTYLLTYVLTYLTQCSKH